MKTFFILVVIVSLSALMGETEVIAKTSDAIAAPQNISTTEVVVLKAQLETMRQYQDRFISMAQWSLNSVIGLALALAVFSWYNNKTSYERDRDALSQQSKLLSDEVRTELIDEIRRTTQETDANLVNRQSVIQNAIEKSIELKLKGIGSQIAQLKDEVLTLKYDAIEREAEDAKKSGRSQWAIYKYCQLLDLSVQLKTDSYEVGDTLDEIKTILDKPEMTLDAETVISTVETLKRLPIRYHTVADGLIQRIKKA